MTAPHPIPLPHIDAERATQSADPTPASLRGRGDLYWPDACRHTWPTCLKQRGFVAWRNATERGQLPSMFWHQNSQGIKDEAEANDRFGNELAGSSAS